MAAQTMFQVARMIGETLREVIQTYSGPDERNSSVFSASIILGGQIEGMPPRLFLIYPEGNFIEAQDDAPFFLIGETKYGRPILVRAQDPDLSFEEAVKLLLVSFDSTIKANLSVGLPPDLMTYETDSFKTGFTKRIQSHAPYFRKVSDGWGAALKDALADFPNFEFD